MSRLIAIRACRRLTFGAVMLVALLVALPDSAAAGRVDGQRFIEIAGEDAVSVEVNLSGGLLRLVCSFDADLCEIVRGINMIQAVILDLSEVQRVNDKMARLGESVAAVERGLLRNGWERVAMIREPGETVRVLVRNTETTIEGLVVLILSQNELVFTNIDGVIDLERLGELVEQWDIPGLEDLDLEQLEKQGKKKRVRE